MSITIKLEVFEGPLDLLLHLIEKNKLNIYDIPIVTITDQYMEYLNLMEDKKLEAMSEFLVMAATLLSIKSSMLLPVPKEEEEEEEDPREELVIKLLEYKKFRYISEQLKGREEKGQKIGYKNPTYPNEVIDFSPEVDLTALLGNITLQDIYRSFQEVIKRKKNKIDHVRSEFKAVDKDLYTIDEKIEYILDILVLTPVIKFFDLFRNDADKMEVVVTFLALLELIKIKKIKIEQKNVFQDIMIMTYDGRDVYAVDRD